MNTKYDYALSQNPGKIIVVRCDACGVDYDVRLVSNEVQHPNANHVMSFDCPKGHHREARRTWKAFQAEEELEPAEPNAEVRAELKKYVEEPTPKPEPKPRRSKEELALLLKTVLGNLVKLKEENEEQ
jgi:hypothetical protein